MFPCLYPAGFINHTWGQLLVLLCRAVCVIGQMCYQLIYTIADDWRAFCCRSFAFLQFNFILHSVKRFICMGLSFRRIWLFVPFLLVKKSFLMCNCCFLLSLNNLDASLLSAAELGSVHLVKINSLLTILEFNSLLSADIVCVVAVLRWIRPSSALHCLTLCCLCDSHVDLWQEIVSISDLFAVACKK